MDASIDWRIALQLAGVKSKQASLPARSECPLCDEGELRVYCDPRGGFWFWCDRCRRSGGMVDLIQQACHVPCAKALRMAYQKGAKLDASELTDESIGQYLERHHLPARRSKLLWEICLESRQLQKQPRLRDLCTGMGWRYAADCSWNEEGIEQLLTGHTAEFIRGVYGHQALSGRWDEALLIPFCDLPGRVCGLQAVGRGLSAAEDFPFLRRPLPGRRLIPEEGGLLIHPLLWTDDTTLVATRDWARALQLLSFSFVSSPEALPLIAWRDEEDGRTDRVWDVLLPRDIVFWCEELDPATLRQAMRTNGCIGHSRLTEVSAEELLRDLVEQAKPWQEKLDKWLRRAETESIERYLLAMGPSPRETEKMLEAVSAAAAGKLSQALRRDDSTRSVVIGDKIVLARPDGWFCRRSDGEELISDVTLQIDEVVWDPDAEEARYAGELGFEGRQIPFVAGQSELDRDGFGWAQRKLMSEGLGFARYNKSWTGRATQIAASLRKPVYSTAASRVGWCEETGALELPYFRIHVGGRVEVRRAGYKKGLPGWLPLPWPLLHTEQEALKLNDHLDRVTLSLWACVAADALADACGMPRRGTALVGRKTQIVADALLPALGCLSVEARSADAVFAAADAHAWPVLAAAPTEEALEGLLCRSDPKGLIVPVGASQSRLLALSGKWNIVTDEQVDQELRDVSLESVSTWASLLSLWLQEQLSDGVSLGLLPGELCWYAASAACDRVKVDWHPGRKVTKALWPAGGLPEEGLADIAGQVLVQCAGESKISGVSEFRVHVPVATLARLSLKQRCPVVPVERLMRSLDSAASPSLQDWRGHNCISVKKDWWPRNKRGRFINIF